jgi:predicted restriction endonuclease
MAAHAGDSDLMAETLDQIAQFNASRPSKAITRDTLVRSQRARAAAEKEMIAGVRFDKDLRQEIIEKFYEDED